MMTAKTHKALSHRKAKSEIDDRSIVEKICNFKGRIGRAEFYLSALVCIVTFVLVQVMTRVFYELGGNYVIGGAIVNFFGLLAAVYFFSVSIRRLHDLNKSGIWVALYFTGVGLIALFIYFAKAGDKQANRFGQPPRSPLDGN